MTNQIDFETFNLIFTYSPTMTDKELQELRNDYTKANEWRNFVRDFLPWLDPDEQYRIKVKENEKTKKKQCGESYLYLDKNMIPRLGRYKCGLCDNCKVHEAEQIRKAILNVCHKPLRIIEGLPDSERQKEIRRLRDKGIEYRTYLYENEGQIKCDILISTEDEIGDKFNRIKFDYERWAGTVTGKRQTGNLIPSNRTLVRDDKKDDKEIVDQGNIMFRKIIPKFEELPCKTLSKTMEIIGQYAVAQTIDLAPTSIKEMQQCFRKREDAIIEGIQKLGGVVYGIEFYNSSMRYITKDTPKECLEAAKEYLKDGWQEYFSD